MRAILTVALTLFCAGSVYSQPALCVSEYLAKRKTEQSLGIAAADAERLVSEVGQSIGLRRNVTVVPCPFAEKAYAWLGKPSDDLTDGEYIIYNPDWVREILGRDRIQAIALFAHELGHFLNADFTSNINKPRREKERDADHFAGCAVAQLSGDFSKLEDLLSRLRLENDSLYPDRLSALESARKGFEKCGGGRVVRKCRLPQHGVESWGYERTITRDSNWRGGGGSQPGYCAELKEQLQTEYPDAQELLTITSSEETRDDCQPFRCIKYQYHCTVTVRGKPIFKEQESKNCP